MLSRVQLLQPHGLEAHQVPLSMGFSSKNTGVGYHFFLQRNFLTQRLNLCFYVSSPALANGFFTTSTTWDRLCDLWTVNLQAPLSTEFSRQEYWSGMPCQLPEDLTHQVLNLHLLCLQLWQAVSIPLAPSGKSDLEDRESSQSNLWSEFCPISTGPPGPGHRIAHRSLVPALLEQESLCDGTHLDPPSGEASSISM